MALNCQNCGKGIGYGHAVSHAKNRTKRLFKPNIQKLKVMRDGRQIRVKLCTRCIQRLKKDTILGPMRVIQYINADREIKEAIGNLAKVEVPKDIAVDTKKKKAEKIAIE